MDGDGGGGAIHHVVVFPWLAFGHLLPFLELSKSLAASGGCRRISFISTPRNIRRLPAIPPHLSPIIHLVPLPLPPVDGLPEHAEATADLPADKVPLLKKAFDGLEAPFAAFLRSASPEPAWIIHDFAHHWAPRVAAEFRAPSVFFSVFPAAATLAFFGPPSELETGGGRSPTEGDQYTVPPEGVSFPSKVACRPHEARQLMQYYVENNASGISDVGRVVSVICGCSVVAVRSCVEIEPRWLRLLPELYKKPVFPVGLLPPGPPKTAVTSAARASTTEVKIFEWLDKQTPGSVVYVAFGGESALSAELTQELAFGLELSKLPFLWALRKPAGEAPGEAGVLPEGFEERIGGHGVVTSGWIPQLEVLAHRSVGGFLSHCGWSSIIESLGFGHPLVLLPVSPDQGLISRAMVEEGVGLEVERAEDGSFGRETVAATLRLVMVEAEGAAFREKAKHVREVFADKDCHDRYVDAFVRYMRDHVGPQDG